MKEVFEVVGETVAQSIWNLSAGGTPIPLLSTVDEDGHANYMQLAMDNSDDAIRYGREKLDRHEEGKIGAVFVADGYISLDDGTTDALVLEVRVYRDVVIKCQMVIPYRSANSVNGFAIHKPQVTALENIDEIKLQPLLEAFFVGVEAHDKGGKIWHEYYREEDATGPNTGQPVSLDSDAWHLMQEVPFLVFFLMISPEGQVKDSELEAFASILNAGTKYQSGVLNRILPLAQENYRTSIQRLGNGEVDYLQRFGRALSVIDKNHSKQETKAFKLALIGLAQDIQQAKSKPASSLAMTTDMEKMLLARLIVAMNIELDS